jgi:hypothetical protein
MTEDVKKDEARPSAQIFRLVTAGSGGLEKLNKRNDDFRVLKTWGRTARSRPKTRTRCSRMRSSRKNGVTCLISTGSTR